MVGTSVSRLMSDIRAEQLRNLPVILPDGRALGVVHDAIVETETTSITHLFVTNPPVHLVEDGEHIAIPWRWVRSIGDVVLLRWFPQTPVPKSR